MITKIRISLARVKKRTFLKRLLAHKKENVQRNLSQIIRKICMKIATKSVQKNIFLQKDQLVVEKRYENGTRSARRRRRHRKVSKHEGCSGGGSIDQQHQPQRNISLAPAGTSLWQEQKKCVISILCFFCFLSTHTLAIETDFLACCVRS